MLKQLRHKCVSVEFGRDVQSCVTGGCSLLQASFAKIVRKQNLDYRYVAS